jgi:hypothetical protein
MRNFPIYLIPPQFYRLSSFFFIAHGLMAGGGRLFSERLAQIWSIYGWQEAKRKKGSFHQFRKLADFRGKNFEL